MSKNPYEQSKFAKFSNGRGLYALLALCLVGMGASMAVFLTEEKTEEKEKPHIENSEVKKEEVPDILKMKEISFAQEEKKKEKKKETKKPEEKITPRKEEVSASAGAKFGIMPCRGEIIEPFSKGELVKDMTMGDWRTHNGIDIKADAGAKVLSAASGRVADVRNDSLWGTVVEIEHPGNVTTRYCGLNENVKIVKGDSVKSGEEIGEVGFIAAESSKGSHLHFEYVEKGKYKDPQEFIN